MINKQKINIALKMLIAGLISFIIARLLLIEYYVAAPAISILSIQLTRKDFIEIAIKRYISGLSSILVSALLFNFFGINVYVFAVILVLLLILSWAFNASEGIVLSVVLISHFIGYGKVTKSFVGQEILLLTISIGVAFIINMFYPNKSRKAIVNNLRLIDEITSNYLKAIVKYLNEKKDFDESIHLNKFKELLKESELIDKNIILENDQSYLNYLTMREVQINILIDIKDSISKIKINHEYVNLISEMLLKIAENISFDNKALSLKDDLEQLNSYFVSSPLPKSREEFETRAILIQILNEIERFLSIKIDFHNKYPYYNKGVI